MSYGKGYECGRCHDAGCSHCKQPEDYTDNELLHMIATDYQWIAAELEERWLPTAHKRIEARLLRVLKEEAKRRDRYSSSGPDSADYWPPEVKSHLHGLIDYLEGL